MQRGSYQCARKKDIPSDKDYNTPARGENDTPARGENGMKARVCEGARRAPSVLIVLDVSERLYALDVAHYRSVQKESPR